MNSIEYKELLLDPRWISLKKYILKRDKYRCKKCKKSNCVLHVHHKLYIKDKNPWDIPNEYLVTLCEDCHQQEHNIKPISLFIKQKLPNKRRKKSKPKIWVEGKGLVNAH